MGSRSGSRNKSKTAQKPSLRDFFSQSSQACPLLLTLLALSIHQQGHSEVFSVTDPGDYSEQLKEAPRVGTLRDALRRAKKSPGAHTILIVTPQPILLKSSLPPISEEGLKIIGGNNQPAVIDGQNQFSFGNAPKNLTIENVTIQQFGSTGYAGGHGSGGGGGGPALGGFTYLGPGQGTFTFNNVVFSSNSATGGAGGDGAINYTGTQGNTGHFVEGGGGGAGPGGAGGHGETNNIYANEGGGGGYGGGGGGGGGLPGVFTAANGGNGNGFGGGGGASQTVAGAHSSIPSPNPSKLPPANAQFPGAIAAESGSGGGFFLDGKTYIVNSGSHSVEGGGGGGAGNTSANVTGTSDGGSSNVPAGNYLIGGGGGGGGGSLSAKSGSGGSGGIYGAGGGGGSSIKETASGQGGNGGFGAGGGGAGAHSTLGGGLGGYGGGKGGPAATLDAGSFGGGGGGGAALGGVFYIDSGISPEDAVSAIFNDCVFDSAQNRTLGGAGGKGAQNGSGFGNDIYTTAGSTVTINMVNRNATLDLDGDAGARSNSAVSLSAGGLNVNGAGKILTLINNASHFSGPVTVGTEATLSVDADGALGIPSNPLLINSGTLVFNNLSTKRNISLSGVGTLLSKGEGFTLHSNGTITDGASAGTLRLTGQGTYNINPTAANTYSGGTEIGAGLNVSTVSGDRAFGSPLAQLTFLQGSDPTQIDFKTGVETNRPIHVLGDATINVENSPSSLSGPLHGTAQLTLEGGDRLTINAHADTTYAGTIINRHDHLTLSGNNPVGSKATLVSEGAPSRTLHFKEAALHNTLLVNGSHSAFDAQSGSSTISGTLSGTSDISYTSSGGLLAILPNNNNSHYVGTFSLGENAVLQTAGTNSVGTGTLAFDGGSLQFVANGTYGNSTVNLNKQATIHAEQGSFSTFGPSTLFQGTGGLTLHGPGRVDITSSGNTYSSETVLDSGVTLGLAGTKPLSDGTVVIRSGNFHLLFDGVNLPNTLSLQKGAHTKITAELGSAHVFSGPIDGDASSAITFTGPGTLQLNGCNTTFKGAFAIESGTIKGAGTNPFGVGEVLLAGGSLVFTDSGSYGNNFRATANNTSITAKSGITTLRGNFNSASGGVTLKGPGTFVLAGSSKDYTGPITLESSIVQVARGDNLGSGPLTLSSGRLDLTESSTFVNPLHIVSGTLNIGPSTSTWSGTLSGSRFNLTGDAGSNLILTGDNSGYAAGFAIPSGLTLSVAKQRELGTGPLSLDDSRLTLSGADIFTNPISLNGAQSAIHVIGDSNTITGSITGSGPLILTGAGTLALTNGFKFEGPTTLVDGVLRVSGKNPLGPQTITLNGGRLESNENSSFTNNIVLQQPLNQIGVDNGYKALFTGTISGVGGLLFNSPGGTLILPHTASYSGGTTLLEGLLKTSGINPLGTGAVLYKSGSLLFAENGSYANDFNLSSDQTVLLGENTASTISGTISGKGALTFSGAAAVTLTSNNIHSGGTTVAKGATLSVASDNALGQSASPFTFSTGGGTLAITSPITFSERTFALDSDGTIELPAGTSTITGTVAGPGSLTLVNKAASTATLAFTAPTNYKSTVLQGVTLQISDKGTLGTGPLFFSANDLGHSSTLNLLTEASYDNPIVMAKNGTIIAATASTTNTFTNSFSGTGDLILQGPGHFSLTADNSLLTANLSITETTLHTSAGNQLGSRRFVFNKDSVLHLTGSDTYDQHFVFESNGTISSDPLTDNTIIGPITGSGPFVLTGTGVLTLSNAFGFNGTTALREGTLRVSGKNPLGPQAITLNGGILAITGDSVFTNKIFLEDLLNQVDVQAGFTATFSGDLTGPGTLIFNSPGAILVLPSANSYSGGTGLFAGSVQASGTDPFGQGPVAYTGGLLHFAGNGSYSNDFILDQDQTILVGDRTSSAIKGSISGEGAITFAGPGKVVLAGNNTQTGGTTVAGATLSIDSDTALGQAAAPFIFSTEGGTLILSSPTAFSERIFTLKGDGVIQLPAGTSTISSLVTGPGSLTIASNMGGTLALTAAPSHHATILQGATLQIGENGSLGAGPLVFSANSLGHTSTVDLLTEATYPNLVVMLEDGTISSSLANTLTHPIEGSGRLTLQGPGKFILKADNSSFSGGLTINGTTLDIEASRQLGSGGLILSGDTRLNLNGSDTYGQHITFDSNTVLHSAPGSSNLFVGLLEGPGGFTYAGEGTLKVIGNNHYEGGTTLTSGHLQVKGYNPVGTGLLTLNGGHFELTGSSTFTGPIKINANGVVHANGADVVGIFSGEISGFGALMLETEGHVVLSGNNSYAGGTILSKGHLKISGASPLGTGPLIFNGGRLELGENTNCNNSIEFLSGGSIFTPGGTTTTLASKLKGAGTFTKSGAGTLRLTGNSSLTGATELAGGGLVVLGSNPSSSVTIQPGAVLSGTGKVHHIDVVGILQPGDSTGALAADHVVFRPGSVFRPLCLGDQTSVLNTETITIHENALIDPFLDPFLPHSYTIATGVINNESPFTFGYSGTPLFPLKMTYSGNSIVLSVTSVPLNEILPNGNLQKIGKCFENLTPSDDLTKVTAVLNLLPLNQIASVFAQFDTSFYNAIAYVEEAATYRTRAIYTAHAQSRRFQKDALWGVWGTGFGESIHQHKLGEDRGQSGYDDHLAGFVTGFDAWALDNILMSGGFSYGHSTVHWNQAHAQASVKSYTAFLGSTWFSDLFSVDGYASYTYHKADGSRKIYVSPTNMITPPINSPIPFDLFQTPIDRKPLQTSEANSGTFHLGGLYAYPLQWGLSLLSFANLDYFVVSQNTFEEKRGGVLNMDVRSKTSDLLRPEIGVGIGFAGLAVASQNVFANATLSYVKEVRFTGRGTPTTFAGSPCQFQLYGLFPQQNLVSPSIEIGIANYYGFGLTLNYTGIFGSHYVDNGGQLELTYLF